MAASLRACWASSSATTASSTATWPAWPQASRAPRAWGERVVDAATYAVFECVGPMPDAMNELWHRILAEWLPASGYQWASGTDVERYFTPAMTAPDSRSEVWLPVVKA